MRSARKTRRRHGGSGPNLRDDVPDELPPDPVRHAGRRAGRRGCRRARRQGQSRQSGLPVRARAGVAPDHRQSEAAAEAAHPRPAQRRRVARSRLGRGARFDRSADQKGRARGHRPVERARQPREQLRAVERRTDADPLRQSLRLPILEPGDDLLGPRRVRPRPHRRLGDQHQGGHGGEFAVDRPVGRQPGEPAQHRAACGWRRKSAAPGS